MEKVTYSTKRKKRRTRKCLDEIKNRLRRKCNNYYTKKTKSCILESKKLEKRLVTMDRLTLKAMFPNAVRSETVTRPVLEEIKQNHNVNFVDVIKDCALKKTFPLRQEYFCNNILIPECGENDHKNNDAVDSPSSLVLFSPVSKSVNEVDAVTSSTSSQISQDYTHHRYEELMNEIPFYIGHSSSSTTKKDVMKNTINNLQKLYMERCQKKCEENKIKSYSSHAISSKKIVIQNQFVIENPLDYIRLEHEREQNRGSLLESSDSPIPSPDNGAVHSPASPASTPFAGLGLHLGMVIHDTPDYNYYPHRLK